METALKKSAPARTYTQLVAEIRKTIAAGRAQIQKAQAETYWNVGKFISEYVLHGADRAEYGKHIYDNLAKDLNIDKRTLELSVRFSSKFSIAYARTQLTWTHYRSLLSLPDDSRKELTEKTIHKKLTSRELAKEIKDLKDARSPREKILYIPPKGAIPKLKVVRGKLFTYTIIEPPSLQPVEGYKFVDVGFNIWRQIPLSHLAKFKGGDIVESTKIGSDYKLKSSDRTAKDLYTFKATVERIIDGDTLYVHVDCGFETWKRQDLRLRGINCPELSTKEGQAVKRFIEARIKPNDFVVIKTHKDDKYGRYLVDVWYAPIVIAGPEGAKQSQIEWDAAKVAAEGIYLNQELLDNRLAVVMKG